MVSGRAGRGSRTGEPLRRNVSHRACHRRRRGARSVRRGAGRRLRAALRRIRGPGACRCAAHCDRHQRRGLRRSRRAASAQQHAVLLPEQDAVDPDRQLRQTRRAASALVVRASVPCRRGGPNPGDRGARHRRVVTQQRHRRGDPDRPPRPVSRHDRREQQSGALRGRLRHDASRSGRAGVARCHRCGHDRDCSTGPLCAAGGLAVREGRGDVLQSGIPAQHLPPSAPPDGAVAGNSARTGDLGPADARSGRRRRCRVGAAACSSPAKPCGLHRSISHRGR